MSSSLILSSAPRERNSELGDNYLINLCTCTRANDISSVSTVRVQAIHRVPARDKPSLIKVLLIQVGLCPLAGKMPWEIRTRLCPGERFLTKLHPPMYGIFIDRRQRRRGRKI